MSDTQRFTAIDTRNKITEAAKLHFLEFGFDGASIRKIAKDAGVTTSTIFHHFETKANLWMAVKDSIILKSDLKPEFDLTSAKNFLKDVLDFRFRVYEDSEIVKLIQWQQLTENHETLSASNSNSPLAWVEHIKNFQTKKEIRADLDPEHIMFSIAFSSHAPFMQQIKKFTTNEKIKYKKMLLEMFYKQFLAN